MTANDYEKALLALVVWREARGEGPAGMRAVAHVIANRVRAWKASWTHEITSKNQFSSMTVQGDSQTVLWPLPDDGVFAIAETVYGGLDPDPTNGALYYANEAEVTSGWYKNSIIDSGGHAVLAQIGHHTFRA